MLIRRLSAEQSINEVGIITHVKLTTMSSPWQNAKVIYKNILSTTLHVGIKFWLEKVGSWHVIKYVK